MFVTEGSFGPIVESQSDGTGAPVASLIALELRIAPPNSPSLMWYSCRFLRRSRPILQNPLSSIRGFTCGFTSGFTRGFTRGFIGKLPHELFRSIF